MRTLAALAALAALLALSLPLAVACDAPPPPPPAGDDDDDDDDDDPAPCAPGDVAEAELAAGEVLAHCGAEVTARVAGVHALEVVEAPAPLPFGLEPAGLAFAFTPPGDEVATLTVPAERVVDGATRIVRFQRHDGGQWFELEACVSDEDSVGQDVPAGVYAALREDRAYPENKDGLGEGVASRTLDGVTLALDVDADLGSAIFDLGADGGRSFNLFATAPLPEDHLDTLRIVLFAPADGPAEVIEITTGATGQPDGFFVWLLPVDGVGAVADVSVTDAPGGAARVTGTVQAVVRRGDQSVPFEAAIDILAERFRFPPEGFCGIDG